MFEWFYITSEGKRLLAKAQVNEPIAFTRAQMGNGALQSGQSMERMTQLISPVKELPLAAAKAVADTITVTVQISNDDLQHAIWFREIGLFARGADGEEILYAYGNAGDKADYFPAPTESKVEYILALNCAVGNAKEVTIGEQKSQIFVTREDVIDVERGGTGATTIEKARENLKAAAAVHTHTAEGITDGTLQLDRLPLIPVSKGGTGRNDGKAPALSTGRTIGLSGAVTGTATAFDGSANITIPVVGLDVSKATAGILPVGRGGTGRTDGKTDGLAVARTIALSGGVTGIATAFDGSANISIPVTGLDMGKASSGTLATERGGTGRADGKASGLAAERGFSLSGGATADAVAFDGSGDVELNVTGLDVDKATAGTLDIEHDGTGAANAISARKALKIQCGYVSQTITSLATGAQTTLQVTFPTPCDTVPIVLVAPQSTSSGRMNALVANVSVRTTTGFEIDLYNPSTGASGSYAKGIHWVAIENG